MSTTKGNSHDPAAALDAVLSVFHKLDVQNVESLRDPNNIDVEALVSNIETYAKRKIADSPDIVDQYISSGKQQSKETFLSAIRSTIGISEDKLKDMDYPQMIKSIKDELMAQSSQDAKQWDKERMSYVQKLEFYEKQRVPELQAQAEQSMRDLTRRMWFMENLMGKELTHSHKIVLNALLPILTEKYEIKPSGEGFTIVNRDGTRVTHDNNLRFLESTEIIIRELELAGFLKQQNSATQAQHRINIIGTQANATSQGTQTTNGNGNNALNRNTLSDSQLKAKEANQRRINEIQYQNKIQN